MILAFYLITRTSNMDLKAIADGLLEVFRDTKVMTVTVVSDEGLLAGKVTDIEYVEDSEGKPCDIVIATDIEYPFTYEELMALSNIVAYERDGMKNKELTIIERSTLSQLEEIYKKLDFAIMYHEAEVAEEADEYEDGGEPVRWLIGLLPIYGACRVLQDCKDFYSPLYSDWPRFITYRL